MAIYRKTAASNLRLDYGEELAIGLGLFPETRDLVPVIQATNSSLEAASQARLARRKPLLQSRVRLRFANWSMDNEIRTFARLCEAGEGGRRGPITADFFPDHLTPVVAPRGRAQIKPSQELVARVRASKVPGADAVRTSHLAPVETALAVLIAAGAEYDAALAAFLAAFATELGERNEHRRQVQHLIGMLAAAFPTDRDRQRVVLPESDASDAADDDAEDPAPVPTPA